jgi:hypothetical protein
LELFMMLMLRGVEKLADDPVVKIDHLIGDGRGSFDRECDQGCVPALLLELHQVGRVISEMPGNDFSGASSRLVILKPAFEYVLSLLIASAARG